MGDAGYAELVAVTVILVAIDVYAWLIGVRPPDLCEPLEGAPARERPDGLGDVGVWIPMTEERCWPTFPGRCRWYRVERYAGANWSTTRTAVARRCSP